MFYLDFRTMKKKELNNRILYVFWVAENENITGNKKDDFIDWTGISAKSFEKWTQGKRRFGTLRLLLILEGLREFLEEDFNVIAEAGDENYRFDQYAPREDFLLKAKSFFKYCFRELKKHLVKQ